jgi:hypothetical protein
VSIVYLVGELFKEREFSEAAGRLQKISIIEKCPERYFIIQEASI